MSNILNFYKNMLLPNFKYIKDKDFYYSIFPYFDIDKINEKWDNSQFVKYDKFNAINLLCDINLRLESLYNKSFKFPNLQQAEIIFRENINICCNFWIIDNSDIYCFNRRGIRQPDKFDSQYLVLIYS